MSLANLAKKYKSDVRGSVAVTAALALIPIMSLVGAAVDYSRSFDVEETLQRASDSAVLAGSKTVGPLAERRLAAFQAFDANFIRPDGVNGVTRTFIEVDPGHYRVDASAKVDTSIMQLVGVDEVKVGVDAEAKFSSRGTEIAFAFDITNSMGFGTSWSDAMTAMSNTLESMAAPSGGDDFYVSLIPFSDRVNVGTTNANWADPDTFDEDGSAGWNGCFEPREQPDGGYTWAMDDDGPNTFPFTASNEDTHISSKHYCPPHRIVGPTPRVNKIKTAMNSLSKGSTGRFDEGLVWAWRMLSRDWVGKWGVAGYPARPFIPGKEDKHSRVKVAVLISDGHTNIYRHEVGGDGSDPYGWNNGSPKGFQHLVHMCERMKDDHIEVHVMHVNGNTHAAKYFKECASEDKYHKVHDTKSLEQALAALHGSATNLRLVR